MKSNNGVTGMSVQSLFDLQTNGHNDGEYLEHAKCKEGKPCTHICWSEDCESQAIVCGDIKCDCQKDHQKKKFCSLQIFPAVVRTLQDKRKSFPDLLNWINTKYDELIDWISEQREKNYLKTKLAGLTQAQIAFLTGVYGGKSEGLTGKTVHQAVKDLNLEKEKLEKTESLIINRISDQWKMMTEKIQKQVSAINQLITDACKRDFSVKGLESKVAVTEDQRLTVTGMFIGGNRKVLKYELLYRASENNFDTSKFWEKCNHKADTVTLIHTEFDKVIGGYTPLSWKKEKGNDIDQEDSSLLSFVFSVTEKTKFTLNESKKQYAIRHHTKHGPIFGAGYDIVVHNNANSNNSWAGIGWSYENSKVQYKTKESWQFFQGSTEKSVFKIKEWEVWQVIFE